ncbi:prenyltransferase/squalene oxidase repeat-containing protein [Tautonia marina]|uniref:prenyltransferase/squalene oxidase repeat-containing protein n=1 Tax=Tautonia marina TaxID=2653855 RepID=UPI001F3FCB89|nr:prenyltransferase/squalene oxidase repeat-containing protein [Tautonia marina]
MIPLSVLALLLAPTAPAPADPPEVRAIRYLAQEVPRWRPENGCASCHHNGDGAHALFRAASLGFEVPPEATTDSIQWLLQPDLWDDNGGQGTFSDKRLARLQFARALTEAVAADLAPNPRSALTTAADQLAADQQPDGSWPIDGPDTLGSPATYGWSLTALTARRILATTDPDRYRDPIAAADHWLRARPIRTTLDASVALLHEHDLGTETSPDRRRQALDLLLRAQSPDGGWGPYETSPPEVFDTALAVLALAAAPSTDTREHLQRGRSYLIATQLPSGGWPETTRPSGSESDAQHYSTTAWATLALLATKQ